MSRRVLVTGGSGFVGQWFCRHAAQRGWTVFAGRIDAPHAPAPAILSQSEHDAVRWLALDITSQPDIDRALESARPDLVLHLAGIAFPPSANADPVRTYEINALGAARLLYSLGAAGATATRVLVVGTAEQYGPHARDE